eukprot:Filipodium_phascolosomae@DN639_c0_g1_i1.p1
MVCDKCEKKLTKIITPDVWKTGSRNVMGGKDGGRKTNENSLLSSKKRFNTRSEPYMNKCQYCHSSLYQGGLYCASCAHKKGLCTMCGKKMVDVSWHNMSMV